MEKIRKGEAAFGVKAVELELVEQELNRVAVVPNME